MSSKIYAKFMENKSETKTHLASSVQVCQNCKQDFTIEPDDFAFYEKIKVPPPTWCPECRMMRRMQWMNFRSWYNRTIDGEPVLSIYAPDVPIPIMSVEKWWSDDRDPTEFGLDYDFSKSFFTQFAELYKKVPQPNMLIDLSSVDCDYCNDVGSSKNCYLSTTIIDSEDTYYSTAIIKSKEIFNCYWLLQSERCYGCIDTRNSRGCLFSQYAIMCLDSAFLFDCHNCSDCIACVGLRHKQYCIFNKQYTKEEYQKFVFENLNGGHDVLVKLAKQFEEFKKDKPVRYANITHSTNVSGNNITGSKNCYHSFDTTVQVENVKYVSYAGLGLKDSYDGYNVGSIAELLYECLDCGSKSSDIMFSVFVLYSSSNILYSGFCTGSSNLFGCVGLNKKQYCILNKQYTKEEYEALVPKIIEHMNDIPYVDKKGRVYKYGEFFPSEISPFAYNETIAQEYYPLNKEEAEKAGYKWREPEKKEYRITLEANNIPDNIRDIKSDIVNEIIGCEHGKKCNEKCIGAFRVIPRELEFYRMMKLSLPRLCPNCRYAELFKKRSPYRLWHRQCMCDKLNHEHNGKCQNEFETSYSPNRSEIVYCEQCYNAEVA